MFISTFLWVFDNLLWPKNVIIISWVFSRGQLGHCDLEPEETPRIVEALAGMKVLQISSGAWHTAAITSDGDLYTWGWGSDGQLGIEDEENEKDTNSGMHFCFSVLLCIPNFIYLLLSF